MILPIIKYGDPRLVTRADEIENIDDEIRTLVADMIETMYNEPGVGLAANQVAVLKRVAVIDLTVGEEPDSVMVLINPEVLESEGEQNDEEGCLSFPEISVRITRPNIVVVKALNLEGEEYRIEGEGLLARALMNEIDHLNGVVIVDHLTGLTKQMTLTNIKRLKRRGLWD